VQCWLHEAELRPSFQFSECLRDETVACLLGGYGIPAEVGYAAYFALLDRGLLRDGVSESEIREVLSEPLLVGKRKIKYRFVNTKAKHVVATLMAFRNEVVPKDPGELRAWLRTLPGVGPKTSAWIIRNHVPDADVAVIDVHIFRAGKAMGLFNITDRIQRDYGRLEQLFVKLCRSLSLRPALLDAVIWRTMKDLGPYGQETADALAARLEARPA
jgi:thermostable 8-oxoguanine DNA glycosylase